MISLSLTELAASKSRRHKWAGYAAALLFVLGAGFSYMAFGRLLLE